MPDATTSPSARAIRPDTEPIAVQLERIAIGAVGLTTRALAHAAAGFELTFPQWRAILVLGEADEGVRIGEVAARVGVTLPATSRLLRRLERRGLTVLSTDDRDRRAIRARLTSRGIEVRRAILAHRQDALREVAGDLSERDLRDLVTGLQAIAIRLEPFA